MDQVDMIIAFENGELDHDGIVELFQQLINNGTVWNLQGTYGRTAMQLVREGYCHMPGDGEGEDEDGND